ncbi:NADH-FMN oxidoreductase RutF, flavin reductase (DIM6/NTAB) family [Ekhidna lutea]|uniref:NADH-FMN oxidoreductase RutF, flavin reductase (DIM6/NTAB) family n=1 Tax=Ekhidna lutea TaxID=447679 RepID=A0A239L6G8_EKHLU|nr:flavin reductase family protein [Ekhidna lutea]SNT26187.1 NADH-FMN oxidoreductase RutF, flavin reductase (DIM6/NTAB) family [Ekhidna lutea]
MTIDPKEIPVPQLHGHLLGAVAPRPIAFASTVDKDGNVNLSPFSFFNVFSANPPIMIFSPARRGRDNTTKHTLENVKEHAEVVVNVVSYDMVQQMSLSSTEYEKGVNEFVKAGFTEVKSERVKPPRVKEAPVSFECKVIEVKSLGEQGGAGQLVICEVQLMHIADRVLGEDGKIDPNKIDLVSRMGGNWYARASGDAIFEVTKPLTTMGIGVDQIPDQIRTSTVLTGNHLGMLGNVEALPTEEEVNDFANEPEVRSILDSFDDEENIQLELHKLAADLLNEGEVDTAWKVLMMG